MFCVRAFRLKKPMFRQRFRICEVFSIPVYLDISTVFLMLMFMQCGSLLVSAALAILLMFSIVFHELAHSLTARCFGCRTHNIVLTVIGGCASLESIPRKAWQELLTAAAGPASSFLLAVAFYVASAFLPGGNLLGEVMWCAGHINAGLALFNLLPGFPMDGGRIFRSLARFFTTRAKATYVAMVVGRAAAILLVLGPALGVDHIWIIPIGGSIFIRVLIAWMIWRQGYAEYLLAREEEDFRKWTQADFDARVSPPPYAR